MLGERQSDAERRRTALVATPRLTRRRFLWVAAIGLLLAGGGTVWYFSPLYRAPIYVESLNPSEGTATRVVVHPDGSADVTYRSGDIGIQNHLGPGTVQLEAIYRALDRMASASSPSPCDLQPAIALTYKFREWRDLQCSRGTALSDGAAQLELEATLAARLPH